MSEQERYIGLCEDCNQETRVYFASIHSGFDWLCAHCNARAQRERREALDEMTRISMTETETTRGTPFGEDSVDETEESYTQEEKEKLEEPPA